MSATEIIKKDRRLYPVYITNFGCGPDSFITQYFERELNKPFLKIEVDEHTAGAGVITRCEAFVDSLKNFKAAGDWQAKLAKPIKKDKVFKKSESRTIYIPYMGDGALALKSVFRAGGIKAEVINSDDETLELGRRYTLGKECYPFIITTGDMIKILKHNDHKKVAFLMPLTYGPCRFGQYNKLQNIIIKELGYYDVPIISPGAPEVGQFYKEYDMQGIRGLKLLLKSLEGILTIDYLDKMLRKVRPYEINKGETERVYRKYLDEICSSLENEAFSKTLNSMVKILNKARKEFENIPKKNEEKPLIGIVGEIFVRNHAYSNNDIIKKVEKLGAEVNIPPFGEWPRHTNATSKLDSTIKQTDLYYKIIKYFSFSNDSNGRYLRKLIPDFVKGIRFYVANRVYNKVLKHYSNVLEKQVKDFLGEEKEEDIYETWDNAEPYIIKWFGEAALSIGKSIDWIKKGTDGIINVMPFTCMPGTIVTAVSKRIREDYKIPWLNLSFDGLEQRTTDTRLEAFIYQANQYRVNKQKIKK